MPAHRDGADDKGKTIAVALLADFSFDGDPLGEGRQSDFFRLPLAEARHSAGSSPVPPQ